MTTMSAATGRARRCRSRALTAVLMVAVCAACVPADARDVDGSSKLTAADGWLPSDSTLAASAQVPAITRLTPSLRGAVREAARDARRDGVRLRVASGWRSSRYQEELFAEAVAEHGSERAAMAYVLPPDRSAHVTGDAVDVGPTDAMSWMSQHGNDYGLCQTYANEIWHFELATEPGTQCPAPATDSSQGPH